MIVVAADNIGFVGINLLGAAWGAVAFPLNALSVAHANDSAEPSNYVMVSGGLLLMYGVGAIIGPFIASMLMTAMSATGLYVYTGIMHLLLVIYVVYRIFRRVSTPAEHQIAFGDALASAHTASTVYEEEIQQHAGDAT